MSVAVIGVGVMGASVAWHLARLGVRAMLIDRDLTGREAVTASSYGWVGAADHLPSDDPTGFALRQPALAEFARLERELGALPIAARGVLGWCWTEAETAALHRKRVNARYPIPCGSHRARSPLSF